MSLDFYPRKGADGQPVKVDSGFGPSSHPAPSFIGTLKDEHEDRWLVNTPLLLHDHPKIRLLAKRLTSLKATPRDQALACFAHLRAMPFGCIADSTGTSAVGVLRAGKGDCHTKSTLMLALLRSLRIPSRMRFVTMKPDFLYGIADLGGHPIEHAYIEVLLDDEWLALDSHVVDPRLAMAAKARLKIEGRKLGYGMHRDGSIQWDGRTSSFGQFTVSDPDSMPLHDWGAFDDPYQFYSSVAYVRQRLSLAGRVKWMIGARLVNRRVHALRDKPVEVPAQAGHGATPDFEPTAAPEN
ncbi:transglutaminase-like domain-containing protein [Caenimonas sedimenti]|nr:transglutaminase-like domain-containing protein [Caenimonas sedimenti]